MLNETEAEKVERVFGGWLRWSRASEVLALLELVVSQLRRRGFTVTLTIQPPLDR